MRSLHNYEYMRFGMLSFPILWQEALSSCYLHAAVVWHATYLLVAVLVKCSSLTKN